MLRGGPEKTPINAHGSAPRHVDRPRDVSTDAVYGLLDTCVTRRVAGVDQAEFPPHGRVGQSLEIHDHFSGRTQEP